MATARGGAQARAFVRSLPNVFAEKVLPGAARAGAKVIADDAKERLGDKRADGPGGTKVLIADSVKVSVRKVNGKIRARIGYDGPGAYVGRWLEYGTAPHFISVKLEESGGRTARRLNYLDKKAAEAGKDGPGKSLFINGKPVGSTVYHPGARKEPVMRPALDARETDARAAAQAYIARRVSRGIGSIGDEPLGSEDDE